MRKYAHATLMSILIIGLAAGCSDAPVGKTKKADPLPLDSTTATLTVKENVKAAFDNLTEALEVTESSMFFPKSESDKGVDVAEELDDFIEKYIMVEDQLVDDDGTVVTYKLTAEHFCGFSEGTECAEFLAEHPLWIEITSYSEREVDIRGLLGEEKVEAFKIELHKDYVAVSVDLSQLAIAFDEVTASGKIRVSLTDDGLKAATVAAEILTPVSAQFPDEFNVSIGVSAGKLSIDAIAKEVSAAVNIGGVDAAFPYQLLVNAFHHGEICSGGFSVDGEEPPTSDCEPMPSPDVDGTIHVEAAAVTGFGKLDLETEELTLLGIGIGDEPAKASLDGLLLAQVDAETFDVTAQVVPDKSITAMVSPLLDVTLQLKLGPVANDLPNIDPWMADEQLDLFFGGSNQPTFEMVEKGEAIRILAGSLDITSAFAPQDSINAATGQCLTTANNPGAAHPWLGDIQVVNCD